MSHPMQGPRGRGSQRIPAREAWSPEDAERWFMGAIYEEDALVVRLRDGSEHRLPMAREEYRGSGAYPTVGGRPNWAQLLTSWGIPKPGS